MNCKLIVFLVGFCILVVCVEPPGESGAVAGGLMSQGKVGIMKTGSFLGGMVAGMLVEMAINSIFGLDEDPQPMYDFASAFNKLEEKLDRNFERTSEVLYMLREVHAQTILNDLHGVCGVPGLDESFNTLLIMMDDFQNDRIDAETVCGTSSVLSGLTMLRIMIENSLDNEVYILEALPEYKKILKDNVQDSVMDPSDLYDCMEHFFFDFSKHYFRGLFLLQLFKEFCSTHPSYISLQDDLEVYHEELLLASMKLREVVVDGFWVWTTNYIPPRACEGDPNEFNFFFSNRPGQSGGSSCHHPHEYRGFYDTAGDVDWMCIDYDDHCVHWCPSSNSDCEDYYYVRTGVCANNRDCIDGVDSIVGDDGTLYIAYAVPTVYTDANLDPRLHQTKFITTTVRFISIPTVDPNKWYSCDDDVRQSFEGTPWQFSGVGLHSVYEEEGLCWSKSYAGLAHGNLQFMCGTCLDMGRHEQDLQNEVTYLGEYGRIGQQTSTLYGFGVSLRQCSTYTSKKDELKDVYATCTAMLPDDPVHPTIRWIDTWELEYEESEITTNTDIKYDHPLYPQHIVDAPAPDSNLHISPYGYSHYCLYQLNEYTTMVFHYNFDSNDPALIRVHYRITSFSGTKTYYSEDFRIDELFLESNGYTGCEVVRTSHHNPDAFLVLVNENNGKIKILEIEFFGDGKTISSSYSKILYLGWTIRMGYELTAPEFGSRLVYTFVHNQLNSFGAAKHMNYFFHSQDSGWNFIGEVIYNEPSGKDIVLGTSPWFGLTCYDPNNEGNCPFVKECKELGEECNDENSCQTFCCSGHYGNIIPSTGKRTCAPHPWDIFHLSTSYKYIRIGNDFPLFEWYKITEDVALDIGWDISNPRATWVTGIKVDVLKLPIYEIDSISIASYEYIGGDINLLDEEELNSPIDVYLLPELGINQISLWSMKVCGGWSNVEKFMSVFCVKDEHCQEGETCVKNACM